MSLTYQLTFISATYGYFLFKEFELVSQESGNGTIKQASSSLAHIRIRPTPSLLTFSISWDHAGKGRSNWKAKEKVEQHNVILFDLIFVRVGLN